MFNVLTICVANANNCIREWLPLHNPGNFGCSLALSVDVVDNSA